MYFSNQVSTENNSFLGKIQASIPEKEKTFRVERSLINM